MRVVLYDNLFGSNRTEIHGIWHRIILCFYVNIILYFTYFPLKLEFDQNKGSPLKSPTDSRRIQSQQTNGFKKNPPVLSVNHSIND